MRKLTERMSVSMSSVDKARLKLEARERGISLSALMRKKIDEYIAHEDLTRAMAAMNKQDAAIQ